MTDGPAVGPGSDSLEGSDRATRHDVPDRRGLIVAAVLVVAVVVIVGAALGPLGLASAITGGGAPVAPRFVEETATAGIAHTYGGDDTFDVGGGVAVFDCDDDGRPDVYLAGGGDPASLYRNESPTGGALRFSQVASPVTDLTSVTGAYPIDIDGDGNVDLAVLRIGGSRAAPGSRRLPVRAGERASGVSRRRRHPRWRSVPRGRARRRCRRWPSATTSRREADGTYRCPDNEVVRPAAADTRLRTTDPAGARLLSALDALQRLGRVGPARPADEQRPPVLRRRGRRRAAVAVRARATAPRLYRRRRVGASCGCGAWASRATTSPATATPRSTSRARVRTPCRLWPPGPTEPAYHDLALERQPRGHATGRRGRPAAVDRLASGVPGREQRRSHGPLHHQGQRERRSPTTP